MASKTENEFDWAPALNRSVKDTVGVTGWSVNRSGSRVRLRVRSRGGYWGRTLPHTWEIGCIGPVTQLVKDLKALVDGGLELDAAWQQLQASNSDTPDASAAPLISWPTIANNFLRWRETHGNQVGTKTLALERRYLDAALSALKARKPPTRAYDLISEAVKPWQGKARAKKQCVEAIMRMLAYGHDHAGLSSVWILPAHQKKNFIESSKRKTKSTLTDEQILRLIESVPSQEWRNVLMLMTTFGLRPEELFHLTVRVHPNTGRPQFWCSYEKASGEHSTDARWLWPLLPEDSESQQVKWDLVSLWQANLLPLPSMKERGGALSQYLRRLPLWKQWRQDSTDNSEILKPYAFRDSYSLRGHLRGVSASQMSAAMGHSLATHSAHYVYADQDSTAQVFEALAAKS